MPLNTLAVKNAKPKDKPYKLTDERGMFLLVTPAGGKLWRLKYRFLGKENLLALGAFPEVSLADARDAREDARRLLAKGIDPSADRKAAKQQAKRVAGDSFEALGKEWIQKMGARWSAGSRAAVQSRLANHVYPKIGPRAIAGIQPPDVLDVIRAIEAQGARNMARVAHQYISGILRFAVVTGRASRDVSADVRGALEPASPKHHPSITAPDDIGKLLVAIDGYQGTIWVKHALQLLAHTFVRPSELREATWSEIDFDGRLWSVPAERMKMRKPHLVPLTDTTVAIFSALHAARGKSDYVFPGYRSPDVPMSASSLLKAIDKMGYGEIHVPHGFRAMASTRLHEQGFAIDVIEAQLAHAQRGVRGIYNRALYLKERAAMLEWWSAYLDGLTKAAMAR
ncbi:tyrosine-type recombinase/integrase [Paraburkholderia sp. RL17-373-BIF-A]|uniref:tyrosine-type recombinase/integrase n=1 Tax=Paraburkholderia sp. RL17-373-BIF-A TaxID=3031629 RepID=UPI0038BDA902